MLPNPWGYAAGVNQMKRRSSPVTAKEKVICDLIENPSFRRMVNGMARPDEVEYWNGWMEADSRNREYARKAIAGITGFEFRDPQLPDLEKQWIWLASRTERSGSPVLRSPKKGRESFHWLLRLAAVFLLASLAGLGVYQLGGELQPVVQLEQIVEERTVITREQEKKILSFSNGSRIILNENSVLTYRMGAVRTIEVTLEGEAFFEANGKADGSQPAFSVNTPDGVIRDIGTKFLVTVRRNTSRVVLQEGVVEVERPGLSGLSNAVFSVKKGELVEFSRDDILHKEGVNPTLYTSWATEHMVLDRTSLSEFARYLERQFHTRVQIVDPDLMEITLTGAVYFKSLEELVRSVSEVTGIPVYQSPERDTVYIGNPNE